MWTALKKWEGLRLKSDTKDGTWTIGYGHTSKVKAGDVCTEAQASAWLDDDLDIADRCVGVLVSTLLTGAVTQGQYDCLVSLCFNLGATKLNRSTLMFRLRTGDLPGASSEILRWCHDSQGRVLPGLTKRRKTEQQWFEEAP